MMVGQYSNNTLLAEQLGLRTLHLRVPRSYMLHKYKKKLASDKFDISDTSDTIKLTFCKITEREKNVKHVFISSGLSG